MHINDFPLRFSQLMFIGISCVMAYTGNEMAAVIVMTGVPWMELVKRRVDRLVENRYGANVDD